MPFLKDDEIQKLVSSNASPVPALASAPATGNDAPIQACSLDLSIGDIYVPNAKPGEIGSVQRPRSFLVLEQGETALLRTREQITLPPDIGGIAFPPAGVSMKGLLMTNPGHVDPGYSGKLHLTVINMGKVPYQLAAGDRIVRLLLFRLSAAATEPFDVRRKPRSGGIDPVNEELLDRLSHDFMNLRSRMEAAAERSVQRGQLRAAILVPVLAGLIAVIVPLIVNHFANQEHERKLVELDKRIAQLDTRISSIGGEVDLGTIESRLDRLERRQGR